MPQKLTQQQQMKLVQRLSPMQVRYVRLLEMNRAEAEDAVRRELFDNPALAVAQESPEGDAFLEHEELPQADAEMEQRRMERDNFSSEDDMPYYLTSDNSPSSAEGRRIVFSQAQQGETLYEHLEQQLRQRDLDAGLLAAALYIIGNLDSNGYLSRSVESMVDDLAFRRGVEVPLEVMSRALDEVKSLDPPGMGASSLQEMLELQLKAMPQTDESATALRIVREAFEPLTMRHSHRIISALKISEEEYRSAMSLILSLNPRPGASLGAGGEAVAAVPDFEVEEDDDGRLRVSVPSSIPALIVDETFASAQADMKRNDALRRSRQKANEFINVRCNDARDFIAVVGQRQQTLRDVITAIVSLQEQYVHTGDESDLRPMGLKDVAALTGLDISTVSRATAGKYAAMPWGTVALRQLFSEGYGGDAAEGGEISSRSIKAAISRIVETEDKRHPLSDEALVEALRQKGLDVKRRTVAKYREQMNIPPSRLRKQM